MTLRKNRFMRMVAWLAGLCLIMSLLAGCENQNAGEGGSGSQGSSESVQNSETASTEHPVDGEGESQTAPVMSSAEAYQGFLNGEVRLFCDLQEYTFYDSVAEEEIPLYKDAKGYTLKEFIRSIQEINDLIPDTQTQVKEVRWAMLDCGNDGEPELGLWVVTSGEIWGEGYDYQFIIKNIDGKLQICYRCYSQYRSEGIIRNRYGVVSDSYYWGMGYGCTYGFVDAKGDYRYLYSENSDSVYYWDYEPGGISDVANKISEREGSNVFDMFNLVQFRLKEYEEGEDQKQVCRFSYDYYGGEDDAPEELMKYLRELFDTTGQKLCTDEEIHAELLKRYQECGLAETEVADDVDGIGWKDLEREQFWPGNMVTVSTTEQLMAAVESNAIITLEPGTYNLTAWLTSNNNLRKVPTFIGGDDYRFENPEGVTYAGYDDDSWEITICNVRNMIIRSKDPQNPAKIVCESPMAKVLEFNNCSFVELDDLIMGHEIEPGHCSGDVVGYSFCGYCTLDGCDLYGCGAYGIGMSNCESMEVNNSVIRDCTYGCMELFSPGYLVVKNTIFKDCREYDMFAIYGGDVYFEDCTFRNLEGEFLSVGEDGYVGFYNCQFDVKCLNSLQSNPLYGSRVNCY